MWKMEGTEELVLATRLARAGGERLGEDEERGQVLARPVEKARARLRREDAQHDIGSQANIVVDMLSQYGPEGQDKDEDGQDARCDERGG